MRDQSRQLHGDSTLEHSVGWVLVLLRSGDEPSMRWQLAPSRAGMKSRFLDYNILSFWWYIILRSREEFLYHRVDLFLCVVYRV